VVLFEDLQNAESRSRRETSPRRGLRLPGWTWRLDFVQDFARSVRVPSYGMIAAENVLSYGSGVLKEHTSDCDGNRGRRSLL